MNCRRFLLLLPLWLACLGFDAPKAVIDGPTDVPAGGAIVLDGRRSVSDRPLVWKLLPPHESDILIPITISKRVDIAAWMPSPRPGTYRFALVASSVVLDKGVPTDIDLDIDIKEVTVAVPTPVPNPQPQPQPQPGPVPPAPVPPNPAPVANPLYAIMVYDPSKPQDEMSSLFNDPTISGSLAGLKCEWRAWPKTDPKVASLGLAKYYDRAGLPASIVIYDTSGHVYDLTGRAYADLGTAKAIPPPKSSGDMVTLIKSMRGQ